MMLQNLFPVLLMTGKKGVKTMNLLRYIFLSLFLPAIFSHGIGGECDNWQEDHPQWIFCDDFESDEPLEKTGRYFEYVDNDGDFTPQNGVGLENSKGMEAIWQQGEDDAGGLKLGFGRNPNTYINKQKIYPERDFREIYYRMYLRMEENWVGSPAKLSRATVFTSAANWRQAMIAHLWSGKDSCLLLDPASCVNDNGDVECEKYNDFDKLHWLGMQNGATSIFNSEYNNQWICIEHHVKLNEPGESNGLQEFWINDKLETRAENLNFTGTYTEYAINAIFFENYWNGGSIKEQRRYFDNIVVSTEKIGPYGPADINHNNKMKTGHKLNLNCTCKYGNIIITNSCRNDLQGEVSVTLYHLNGKLLLSRLFKADQLNKGLKINIQSKSSGIYLVQVKCQDIQYSQILPVRLTDNK